MNDKMKKQIQEILEDIKDINETNFIEKLNNPWENPRFHEGYLVSYDGGKDAVIEIAASKRTLPLKMSPSRLADFKELARHNDTIFVEDNFIVDWSCLSIRNGTLVPAEAGGDVYE